MDSGDNSNSNAIYGDIRHDGRISFIYKPFGALAAFAIEALALLVISMVSALTTRYCWRSHNHCFCLCMASVSKKKTCIFERFD